MIQKGELVTPSPACKKRFWGDSVKHLEGKEFKVVNVRGEYLIFFCKDGKGWVENRAFRSWHISNLMQVIESLENE